MSNSGVARRSATVGGDLRVKNMGLLRQCAGLSSQVSHSAALTQSHLKPPFDSYTACNIMLQYTI